MSPNAETLNEPIATGGDSSTNSPDKKYKLDIVWRNVIILSILHIGGIYGFYLRYTETMLKTIIFAKACYILSGVSMTAGAHRLWCHKSYKANNIAKTLLMLFTCVTYQNSIYTWSRDHRLHHKFTETDADPHNAKRGFFFSHIGWLMLKKHDDIRTKGKTLDMRDLDAEPIVMFQHRNYHKLVLLFGVLMPTIIPWYFWGESFKSAFFVASIYRYILSMHMTWSINSFAHMYGYKPYEKTISPSENTFPIYTTMGEGFHNYHHAFPWDYKASELGFDPRNLTTCLIDLFAWLGWATELRSIPPKIVQQRANKTGDGTYTKPEDNKLKNSLFHLWHFVIFSSIICVI